jgi:hypothetical protein
MRNTNRRFDLWQIQSSDYPADMRKSIPDQEMWPNDLFAPRGGACARGSHAMSFVQPASQLLSSGAGTFGALHVLAWLNRFTLSLLKQHVDRTSIAMKRRSCGWDENYLLQVLTGSTI